MHKTVNTYLLTIAIYTKLSHRNLLNNIDNKISTICVHKKNIAHLSKQTPIILFTNFNKARAFGSSHNLTLYRHVYRLFYSMHAHHIRIHIHVCAVTHIVNAWNAQFAINQTKAPSVNARAHCNL